MQTIRDGRSPKRNSPKINLTFSFIFHAILVSFVLFYAAREGMFGEQLRKITVTMAPKEKPAEKPKPPPPPPEVKLPEEKRPEPEARPVEVPKVADVRTTAPEAPPSVVTGVAAPAAAIPAGFTFTDGATVVQTGGDPTAVYGNLVEYTLRSIWSYPKELKDAGVFSEVEVAVDAKVGMSLV